MFNTPNKAALMIFFLIFPTSFLSAQENQVSISINHDQRCIVSNGLPDHSTGEFPNRGNPNSISSQSIKLCISTHPVKGDVPKKVRGSIGVALNGVQMRPGTADYYDPSSRRGFSRDSRSGWNLEGLGARDLLGMDNNNAHVDNRGLYHYHGVAPVLAKNLDKNLIGYAADGFAIYYVPQQYKSSHQLKAGIRPSAPGGEYDGTYNEDWLYVKGAGNLDQCNGAVVDGKYRYFATDNYPFFPRCLWGEISTDFLHKREPGQQQGTHNRKQDTDNKRRSPARVPPAQAIRACQSKESGDSCSFNPRNRNQTVTGKCHTTPQGQSACRPML